MKIITNRQTNLQNNAYFATFLPKNAQNHTLYRFKKVIWLFGYLVIFLFPSRAYHIILNLNLKDLPPKHPPIQKFEK